jgi:glycosyltransferase involved in cell wall biosynthesis
VTSSSRSGYHGRRIPLAEHSVCVIIPARNAARFVLDAVASVESQDYPDVSVVVVDNDSTDHTAAVLSAAGVRYLSEPVLGAGAARKAGLRSCRAEFLIFLDADDILAEGAVARLVGAAVATASDLAYGEIENMVVQEESAAWEARTIIHGQRRFLAPQASSSLVRRSAFDRFGDFADDNYSWARWVVRSRDAGMAVAPVEELVAWRRIHGDNMSLGQGSRDFFFGLIRERLKSQPDRKDE